METILRNRKDFRTKIENPVFLKTLFPQQTYFSPQNDITLTEKTLLFLEEVHPELIQDKIFNPENDNIYNLQGFLESVVPEKYFIRAYQENDLCFSYSDITIDDFYPVYLDDLDYIKPIELKIGFSYLIKHLNDYIRDFNWEDGIKKNHFDSLFEIELDDEMLDDEERYEMIFNLETATDEISKALKKVKKYYKYDLERFLNYKPEKESFISLKNIIERLLSINVHKALGIECMLENYYTYSDCFRIQYCEDNFIQHRINEEIDMYANEGISQPISSFIVTDTIEYPDDKEAFQELALLIDGINEFRKVIRELYKEHNGKTTKPDRSL